MAVGTCARCGVQSDSDEGTLPLGWSMATTRRGPSWMCAACTREHTRDIEAKLDEDWWV